MTFSVIVASGFSKICTQFSSTMALVYSISMITHASQTINLTKVLHSFQMFNINLYSFQITRIFWLIFRCGIPILQNMESSEFQYVQVDLEVKHGHYHKIITIIILLNTLKKNKLANSCLKNLV